jgi:hypothetical protein
MPIKLPFKRASGKIKWLAVLALSFIFLVPMLLELGLEMIVTRA